MNSPRIKFFQIKQRSNNETSIRETDIQQKIKHNGVAVYKTSLRKYYNMGRANPTLTSIFFYNILKWPQSSTLKSKKVRATFSRNAVIQRTFYEGSKFSAAVTKIHVGSIYRVTGRAPNRNILPSDFKLIFANLPSICSIFLTELSTLWTLYRLTVDKRLPETRIKTYKQRTKSLPIWVRKHCALWGMLLHTVPSDSQCHCPLLWSISTSHILKPFAATHLRHANPSPNALYFVVPNRIYQSLLPHLNALFTYLYTKTKAQCSMPFKQQYLKPCLNASNIPVPLLSNQVK